MRQRLSVAAALLGSPELLVLDEPANGLDPEGIRWLRNFLRSYAGDGGTVLISSHVLAEVAQLANEVVIIHHGRLVAHESLEALTARAGAHASSVHRTRRGCGSACGGRSRRPRRARARCAWRPLRSAWARWRRPAGSCCTSCAAKGRASKRSSSS